MNIYLIKNKNNFWDVINVCMNVDIKKKYTNPINQYIYTTIEYTYIEYIYHNTIKQYITIIQYIKNKTYIYIQLQLIYSYIYLNT